MVVKKVWLLPVSTVACSLAAMFSGYFIGVLKHHFPAVLPFISDGGTLPPESCLFAQFMNMSAFFLIVTCYMRHRQIVEYYGNRLHWEGRRWRRVSMILMWIGFLSALGVTVLASFPVNIVTRIHVYGAELTFFSAIIYCWGQLIIGYAMVPRMASQCVNHNRLVIAILATGCCIMHEFTMKFHPFVPASAGEPPGGWLKVHWWTPSSPFYLNKLIAAATEWAMILLLQLFILTFAAELRFAYAHAPRVIFMKHLQDEDNSNIVQIPYGNVPPAEHSEW